ncbi:LLM class flavin-dependent oxidoreductase [Streptococcus phocae]|uniref:Luciferase n=1 Tax=Streptococcus phocae TaxID=119224 RepID=A0A0N8FXI1_9STRE|nr:LLM class flavin-dependent oxidoreductase [Streptococcus phocae]KPJ23195.1 luciferase [Streptococcus phocae]
MKLSVLDYGLIDKGKTASQALKESCQLAKRAEDLGFNRFWVAEHHNIKALATSSPEVFMMHLADRTNRIRIGSGGVMALHYSTFKIAENFRMLETLHPNRIDLGIGNSLGTRLVQSALSSIHEKDDYGQVLAQLQGYLSPDKQAPLPLDVNPKSASYPQLWPLSNSEETARTAGQLGLGYTFGIFPYMPKDPIASAKQSTQAYRDAFSPSAQQQEPQVMLAAFIIIAETDDKAQELAKSLDIWMLGNQDFNEFDTYPTYSEASTYPLTEKQKLTIAANRNRMIVGSPQLVKQQLEPLLAASQATELLAIPLVPDIANRITSLELLADLYL